MKTTVVAPHKSSLGMNANLAVVIIYIAMAVVSWIWYFGWVAWIVPIVFYYMEKESGFVKFHAVQALGIGILRAVVAIIFQIFIWILTPRDLASAFGYLTGRGWGAIMALGAVATIIGVAITLLMVYIIYTAWNYKQVELPIIGPMAAKAAVKLDEFGKQAGFTGEDKKDQTQQPPKDGGSQS